jgi:hypothetical protein
VATTSTTAGATAATTAPLTIAFPAAATLLPALDKQHKFLIAVFSGIAPPPSSTTPWPPKTSKTAYKNFVRGVMHDLRQQLPPGASTAASGWDWTSPMPNP